MRLNTIFYEISLTKFLLHRISLFIYVSLQWNICLVFVFFRLEASDRIALTAVYIIAFTVILTRRRLIYKCWFFWYIENNNC